MDSFRQQKLTKSEWVSIEKPIDEKEKVILKLIYNGLQSSKTVFTFNIINNVVNLDHEEKEFYIYLYLLKDDMDKLSAMFKMDPIVITAPKKKLNAGDKIRIENQKKKLSDNIEQTTIQIAHQFYKELKDKKQRELYLYNMYYLTKTYKINRYLNMVIQQIIDKYIDTMDILYFMENVDKFIETNSIFNYKPIELYKHQTDIFNIFKTKTNNNKLVFYRAPTSSGKTLTPIGLCGGGYKVIYMCASRHIGISLSKHAVNASVKVGFALGCNTADDVRLHFSAVSEYINLPNGRKKPDNSKGAKVELMICDIQSYEIAMLYMCSFFNNNDIILVMDEPTITMDYVNHELHGHIQHIWKVNVIPQVILSSATLPNQNEMGPLIEKFCQKYNHNTEIHYIDTIDETTNIALIDNSGNVIMPHNVFKTKEEINTFIDIHGKTHFKFLSIVECAKFIVYVSTYAFKNTDIIIDYFKNITTINTQSLRNLYFEILQKIKEDELKFIVDSYTSYRELKKLDVGINITTKQAYTLTYGPTIFLCKNISDWTDYFIENSGIHSSVFDELNKLIDFNNNLLEKINKKQKYVEDKIKKDEENENKMKEQRFDPEVKRLLAEIETLEKMIKPVKLNNVDIPNTRDHFMRWTSLKYETSNVFSSNIDTKYVKRIMNLELESKYKILLLMGIGIFNPEEHMGDYNDIMKELAENKELLCILATPDYIYGTNYQFCHAYLTEEMVECMTQEKIIQAIGRVGRREKNKMFTFRFKNNDIILKLFIKENSIEINNMNMLFF